MRVIAGEYKGRRLASWKQKLPVRPMTDRVKETVFNVLSPFIFENCRVLDLFSGTGSLSVEAFSRGAGEVHAVERHALCLQLILKNTSFIKPPKKFVLHRKNVFSFLKKYQKKDSLKLHLQSLSCFDLILIDPPYRLKAGDQILSQISESNLIHNGGLLMIQTSHKEPLKSNYSSLKLFSLKNFRDKKVSFYRSQKSESNLIHKDSLLMIQTNNKEQLKAAHQASSSFLSKTSETKKPSSIKAKNKKYL